ncbi:VWA domain-containing protein [Qipengyuania sp. 1NDH17]|uniref:VWA domain-containing protein n=1 Tax=Qipengyuania polymorpha TaxID=2867234 RepID=A0ABS7IZ95_9SPHN|nr:VWA domain-containing protein [Qipengyuania polymorpha]MBX7457650.1 VWA domain-containing protein [Qipengyuania polymorpha]
MSFSRVSLFTTASLALFLSSPASAQDVPDEDEQEAADAGSIIVTATRVRQGGAQDIKHFRSVSLDGDFLPPTSSLTLEGLLGEHDLTLPSTGDCTQLFCISSHAMEASLPGREQDAYFVGLGFDSAIDADAYRAEPVSLIAVVDRSGSMSGSPLERVKEGLNSALKQLRPGDRMGIVIYGSETVVHLPVTDVDGNEAAIRQAIATIESNGSTAMEAGLELGYKTAVEELKQSRGKTRLMLFTDENPNVGNTSAEGFMGQATRGSRMGIGLTTIGVGVHFDGALASRVSSVRGGNLFFLDDEDDAAKLFDTEFYNMVSEVAHDVAITIDPAEGYKVTGVFGVPDGLMSEADDGLVTVTIGSAFLSSNGGGIYFSLGKDAEREFLPARELGQTSPAQIAVSYTDALSGQSHTDSDGVGGVAKAPERLRAAHLLVDQYLTLSSALGDYHQKGERKSVFHRLDALSQRIAAADVEGFENEAELVDSLKGRAAYLAGYAGELPREMRHFGVVGTWRVLRHRGVDDIGRGDRVEITKDNEFITYREGRYGDGDEIFQYFEVNEKRLHIEDTDLVLRYTFNGDRMRLSDGREGSEILLERIESEDS